MRSLRVADLLYFMKNLIQFGHLQYTSCKFVFLGDYVDRGDWYRPDVDPLFVVQTSCKTGNKNADADVARPG